MSTAATLAQITNEHGIALGPLQPVGGGCINSCFRSGDYFLKFNRPAFQWQFEAEAFALGAIEETRSVRVPHVVGHGSTADASYLVLEYLPLQSMSPGGEERLGRELAVMHATAHPQAGFPIDNAIGATPQANPLTDSWLEFWRDHRLGHMFRLAEKQGHCFEREEELMESLAGLLPENPDHVLLHGDLWGGNAACLPDGTPVIFDPASYYGHSETDLAMTRLFGGFSRRFYAAYDEARVPEPGRERRVALYQLYHLLNHLVLFGASYRRQAESLMAELL